MRVKRIVIFSILIISYLIIIQITNSYGLPLRRSCGKDLTTRIANICQKLGGYNVLGSNTETSNTEHHHRVRRRVADECCKNICSDTVISQYCYISSEKNPRTVDKSYSKTESLPFTLSLSSSSSSSTSKVGENMKKYAKRLSSSESILLSSLPTTLIHYRPLKIGTVAPEFTKTAITPQLLSRIHLLRLNQN